jgi:hypothetical protein
VKAESPAALRFILQDDIYLLQNDKTYTDEKPPGPVAGTPAVKLNYLGKYKKAFLVMVHYPGHEFIADVHLTALESILTRKDHVIDDVAIVNMATAALTNLDELLAYFNPKKLLLLGKEALPANMEALVLNEPKQIAGCMALYSFSFDDMMDNTENKKAFWEQMKNF